MSAHRDIWKKVPESIYIWVGGHAANPGTPDVQSTEVRLRRDKFHELFLTPTLRAKW